MLLVRSFLTVLIALIALTPGTSAAEAIRIGDFWLFDEAPDIVVFQGTITDQTPLDFRTALARRPNAKLLALSSPGGQLNAGLLLADDVNDKGLNTYIPFGSGCFSACAFVFLGGIARLSDGDLGVHQFYGGKDTAASAQLAVSDILTYLKKFGTSDAVVDTMLRTPSESMHVFSKKQMATMEITRQPDIALAQTLGLRALPAGAIDWANYQHKPSNTPSSEATSLRLAMYVGVDFYGADVGKVRAKDALQCLERCMEQKSCLAITFNTDPKVRTGPNCFLKDSTGRATFYQNAISAQFLLPGESSTVSVGGKNIPATDVFGTN